MYEDLAKSLFFSKEAAEYLGISTQRLNALVKEGKINPLKKSPSGTIFLKEELDRRKEEKSIFSIVDRGGELGMFQFDTEVKREAANYATLMNVLDMTELRLDPLFSKFSEEIDLSIPLNDPSVLNKYADYFSTSPEKLVTSFKETRIAFSHLRESDEIIKRGNDDYPPLLEKTEQAPRFLYIRGNKSLLFENRTVALVGSRKASEQAKNNTSRLTRILGLNGITIISGLAKGIDVTAHRAALDEGFNTIAVIGTNLNQYYPIENKSVQIEIEKRGLVVSQFSPANKTQRWFFPLRNGVMSGLSLATVIMEAGETSGALKQADFALKQNRQVLIPQSAFNIKGITWPMRFVKRGAEVVERPSMVLEKLAESNIFKMENNSYHQQSFDDLLSDKDSNKPVDRVRWGSISYVGD